MSAAEPLSTGSLFSGGGGFDYGLERAGFTTRWQVEWDPWDQHLLEHGYGGRWAGLTRYADIRAVDWDAVEPVDILAGGFPCQPVSVAGRRLAQADERWLWPEYARAIRHLRPRRAIVENVAGLLGAHGGLGDVLAELAEIGYDAEWACFPASALGAPHHRDRVWLVAYPAASGWPVANGHDGLSERTARPLRAGRAAAGGGGARGLVPDAGGDPARDAADTEGSDERAGLREGGPRGLGRGRSGDGAGAAGGCWPQWLTESLADASRLGMEGDGTDWLVFPPAPSLAGVLGRYGAGPGAEQWSAEPELGRMAHGVARRGDRLWTLGNGVVPQVAEVVGWLVRLSLEVAP